MLRPHLPAPLQSLQYSVAFNPSQVTVDAMRQVVLQQLLDDSRKLAQSLAAAAGVGLGAIRSISDSAGRSGFLGNIVPVLVLNPFVGAPYPQPPSSTQYTLSLNRVFARAHH